jgi:multisubunit Na+/H+ antiporter MnhC subunit
LEDRVTNLPISNIVLATGFILVLIGLWGILTHRNILRIIIGFSLIDTGIHIVIVSIGYVTNGTAPISTGRLARPKLLPVPLIRYHLRWW